MKKIVLIASVLVVSTAIGACNQGRGPTAPTPATPGQNPTPAPPPGPTPPPPTTPTPPPPVPPPPPPVEPFTQTLSGFVGVFDDVSHTFATPRSGTATITLRWMDGSVDLDLLLTGVGCTSPYAASCSIIQSSSKSTGTVESISRQVQVGEEFRIWAANFSHVSGQAYTIEIDIR